MLSLKEPQVQRLDLPHPTLSSVHLPYSPIDIYCQEFLSQCVKWEYLWIPSGDCPILRMMKGLRRNQLERIPIGFGRTASGKHQSCVSAQNPWPFAPFVLPLLGKIEGKRRKGQQRMRWLASITNSLDMNLSKLRGIVKDREAWCATDHGVSKSQTPLSD